MQNTCENGKLRKINKNVKWFYQILDLNVRNPIFALYHFLRFNFANVNGSSQNSDKFCMKRAFAFLKIKDTHSRPEIFFKKIEAKKLVKSNKPKNIFSWNCIFGSFKLFPNSKIDFWPFLKLQKMEFGQKNYSWNWFIWFHEFFFWPELF